MNPWCLYMSPLAPLLISYFWFDIKKGRTDLYISEKINKREVGM